MIRVKRVLLGGVLCVASLLGSVCPAGAVGNGVDPAVAGIREPVSGQLVDDWKLAGRASASGVQVAPQWVLTTRHAPGAVGGTFTNAYGTARIDSVTACPGASCDLSLSHLVTALPAPAFPDLVDNGIPGIPEVGTTLAGALLAVGLGGGKLTAAWTSPTGAPTLATMANPPAAISGDSGGPVFYHRPGDPAGHLVGLMTYGATWIVAGVPQFSADAKAFITGVAGAAVRWTTFDQLGPRQVLPTAITDFTATAVQNTMRLTWNPVAGGTAYTAVLINPADPADRKVVRTTGTTAAFTVVPGVRWAAFVLPETSTGQALVPAGMDSQGSGFVYHYTRFVAAGPAPTPVRNVTVESTPTGLRVNWDRGPEALPDVNTTELRLCPSSDIQCVTPRLRVTSESPGLDFDVPGIAYGDRFTLALTDRNPSGVSAQTAVPVSYLPLLPPAMTRSVTAHLTDTKITFGYDTRGDDPLTVFPLTGYHNHAPADIFRVTFVDPQGRKRSLATVDPKTQPSFDVVLANWRLTPGRYDFTLTPYNWMWGEGTPTVVTVPVGTPGDYSVAAKVPAAPVITGGVPLTWTQPGTERVDSYLLVELVSGQVYEVGPNERSFDIFSTHLQQTQQWRVIATNHASGESLPVTGPYVEVPGD
ncbi:hypothetical protein [Actinokineospora inagensis]|uniref:hypothetical protein n=1 Tax=Actinokineospora inagensis TaxID=103730 RepID=UPI0012FCE629|nr:hypothetical protein [Actinokineospora inagensis]